MQSGWGISQTCVAREADGASARTYHDGNACSSLTFDRSAFDRDYEGP